MRWAKGIPGIITAQVDPSTRAGEQQLKHGVSEVEEEPVTRKERPSECDRYSWSYTSEQGPQQLEGKWLQDGGETSYSSLKPDHSSIFFPNLLWTSSENYPQTGKKYGATQCLPKNWTKTEGRVTEPYP